MIHEQQTYEELMNALHSIKNSRFQLQFVKLDVSFMGKTNIIKLLNNLDMEVSTLVSLNY